MNYRDRRNLVNSVDAAVFLFRAYHVRVTPERIRQWAARKHIPTHGLRRERYDLREVVDYARQIGLISDDKHERKGPHGQAGDRSTGRRPRRRGGDRDR